MKNKSIKSKVLAGVVMASMILSSTAVFADTSSTTASSTNTTKTTGRAHGDHKGGFKTVLDGLVTAGTISSDKATAIENTIGKKHDDTNKGGDRFKTELDALVSAGTITSDEETAIIAAFENNK